MNNSFDKFTHKLKDTDCHHVCIQVDNTSYESNENYHSNASNHISHYFTYSLPAPSLTSKPSTTSIIIQDIKDTSLYTSISSLWSTGIR